MMVRAESGDYFNRAQLLEDLQARPHAVPRPRLRQRRGHARRPTLDPETHEVDVIVPVVARAARAVRAHRGPRQHQDARQGDPPRARGRRGRALPRDQPREVAQAPRDGARLLRARRSVSTEQGSAPDKMNVYIEVTERADRHVPGRRRLLRASRTSSRRRRSSRRTCSATARACRSKAQLSGIRQLVNLRFFEPYFLDSKFSASIDLYDQLRVYRDFSQRSLAAALTIGYPLIEPELYGVPHLHRRARRGLDRDALDAARHGLDQHQRVQAPAAREPVQRRLHVQHPPGPDLRHARQPPVPDRRRLPVRPRAELATSACSAPRTSSSATA